MKINNKEICDLLSMEFENGPFDLHDVIMRCQSVILPSAKEKGLDLRFDVEPLLGKKLLGDPIRLYQVLMNFLSNAVKFTDTGTVQLSSQVKRLSGGNRYVTIYFEVKDSGIGMDPDQVEKIFDHFVRSDSSTARNYDGMGLGLTITKNIVELMGGKLMVESSPGAGSTFSFEILFETIGVSCDTQSNVLEKPHFSGLILICDDTTMSQQVLCDLLARLGLRTVAVENGKMGVEMVRERMQKDGKPFDLIFMDIIMPVMDGMEAASKIRELNTGTPIVAMTANAMSDELEKYSQHGMSDCLSKPFTTQELWRILLKYLTPESSSITNENEQIQEKNELQKKLRANFVKNNQTKYNDIVGAIAGGDIKLAYRLAHTLKGNAGMIRKTELQSAAAEVEALLKDGKIPIKEDKMNRMEAELKLVIEELRPLLNNFSARKVEPLNAEQVLALFEKLEDMLVNINPACVNLLDEINAVQGAEELARQIADYDFESALCTLDELKKKWM